MLKLRITQRAAGEGRHQVDLSLEGDGAPRKATATFDFSLSPQDEEDLRWYLEDFLQHPEVPAPTIARRIEGRMAEVGTKLFQAVFQTNDQALHLWGRVSERLSETRIEIVSGISEASSIPWELLRDPERGSALALTVPSFVRAQPSERSPRLPGKKKKIRILLVICRPQGALGAADVPFRSVASQLIRGLSEANREAYDLDVLRPPTFEQLGKTLRQAQGEGNPYHIVHFDGHGAYIEVKKGSTLKLSSFIRRMLSTIWPWRTTRSVRSTGMQGTSTARCLITGSRFTMRRCRATSTAQPRPASTWPLPSLAPAAGRMPWSTPRRRCGDSRASGRGRRR